MDLQSLFLKEKSFEGYDDSAVLECLLSTAGIRAEIPNPTYYPMDNQTLRLVAYNVSI